MKYSDLNKLWSTQEDQLAEWRDALRKQCALLRDAFIAHAEPPVEPWTMQASGEKHSYVTLLYLHPEPKRLKGHIPPESLTDNGELMFGLSVTFDHDPGSFPKETVYLTLAVRFNANEAQFAFFNTALVEAESPPGWVADIPKFVELMLERLQGYVASNPFAGPPDKKGIGFL